MFVVFLMVFLKFLHLDTVEILGARYFFSAFVIFLRMVWMAFDIFDFWFVWSFSNLMFRRVLWPMFVYWVFILDHVWAPTTFLWRLPFWLLLEAEMHSQKAFGAQGYIQFWQLTFAMPCLSLNIEPGLSAKFYCLWRRCWASSLWGLWGTVEVFNSNHCFRFMEGWWFYDMF